MSDSQQSAWVTVRNHVMSMLRPACRTQADATEGGISPGKKHWQNRIVALHRRRKCRFTRAWSVLFGQGFFMTQKLFLLLQDGLSAAPKGVPKWLPPVTSLLMSDNLYTNSLSPPNLAGKFILRDLYSNSVSPTLFSRKFDVTWPDVTKATHQSNFLLNICGNRIKKKRKVIHSPKRRFNML